MIESSVCEIYFSDNKKEQLNIRIGGSAETESGLYAMLRSSAEESCTKISLRLESKDERNLRAEKPVRLSFSVKKRPQALTAMYMLNPWWTRPAFIKSFEDIPEKTRIVFAKYGDCYACLFPMAGRRFVTMMEPGTESGIVLEMSAGTELSCNLDEPVFLYAEGSSVHEAVHRVFAHLEKEKGLLPREERKYPEMLKYLGWCSWDAFYRDVSEEGIRAKAKEFKEKNIPVRWMLVDDGWQQVTERTMDAREPDSAKFPDGFLQMTKDIRTQTMVKWFGVWHALFGYWDGITPDSPLWTENGGNMIRSKDGKILPDPDDAEGFYRGWYEQLKADGIDFTKVDGQSSLTDLYKNTVPVFQAARGVSEGLEKASSVFNGAVINCMGMAMENILARAALAVSRNSDDFVPSRENGFAEHLLQNAWNSLYHNELYCCDWDMFWTKHPDAQRHALIRAVSGGPVYFSDRVGETEADVLKTLCYPDGELLMMSRSAMPTEDCIFNNPLESGVLKLHNAGTYASEMAGGTAVFNLTSETQTFRFSAPEVPELSAEKEYLVYDWFGRQILKTDEDAGCTARLPAGGSAWYVFLPQQEITCLGLTDKYAGFMAVTDIFKIGERTDFVLHACGNVGFVTEKEVLSVSVNGKDMKEFLERNGNIYTLRLPEKEGTTIVSVTI